MGVAIGMSLLIAATFKEQKQLTCKNFQISIQEAAKGKQFTTPNQFEDLVKIATKGNIKGQLISDFDLPVIEELLEQSPWVYNAALYFDNQDILHINIVERKPLARVFTNLGESFYIDETGRRIPLSDKVSVDVPVFTGFPEKRVWNSADSSMLQNVIATASFVSSDSFWNAQVAQININSCGADCWDMEMIPVVGNHKIDLGDGSDIASKFHRLYLFYDQVLKRTGFDKYQKIDVQYTGQVIGVKGQYTKIDSIQLRKNIELLLQQSRKSNELIEVAPSLGVTPMSVDTSAEAKNMYQNNEADSLKSKSVKKDSVRLKPQTEKSDKVDSLHKKAEKQLKEADKKTEVKIADKNKASTKPVQNEAAKKNEAVKGIKDVKESNNNKKKETTKN